MSEPPISRRAPQSVFRATALLAGIAVLAVVASPEPVHLISPNPIIQLRSPQTNGAILEPALEAENGLGGAEPLPLAPTRKSTAPAAGEPSLGHQYFFPVQPPTVARYDYEHRKYPAVDILAPFGTPVVAVTDGVVEALSREDVWNPVDDMPETRAGLFVSLVGDDGVRYYASHFLGVAGGLEVGQRVTAGQVIGYVGNSGNAGSLAPHVHFGISRPTYPGDWETRRGEIWPQEYLDAWAKGIMISPVFP